MTVLCNLLAALNSVTAQGLTSTTNTYVVGGGPQIAAGSVKGS
jgi:hypothetical protein